MNRPNNFKYDNDTYGKFGERVFVEYAKKNRWQYTDVSDDEGWFRDFDVDFLCIFDPEITKDTFVSEKMYKKELGLRYGKSAITFEVKTDLVTHKTGNVVYELISYDRPGCLARSLADFIFYVQTNAEGNEVQRVWNINLYKWRQWLREHDKVTNKEGSPIRVNSFDPDSSRVLNFLCKIDTLVKDGVAKEVNWEKFWKN